MRVPRNPAELGLPFDTWRIGQREVIEEILTSPARVVLLRARTGFGKAAVALGLALLGDRGGLILTHTHQLQEQYGKAGAAIVKGKPNFWCPSNQCKGEVGMRCKQGACVPGRCEYAEQKWIGEQATVTTTNYAYALRVMRSGSFTGRSWIVCDEGQHFLGTMEDVLAEEEEETVERIKKQLREGGQYAAATQLQPAPPPLWPSQLFPDRIQTAADRVLVMSATLPDKKVWSYLHGVPVSDILQIDAPDTWPNNSPLYIWPVVSLNRESSSLDYDQLADAMQRIITEHPDCKGLIHAHSYSLMRQMYERLNDPRVIWGFERKPAIRQFVQSKEPAVLFATAVHEGFDLPYEIGFQIIPKAPFPSLGDPQVKARARQFKVWYAMETINAVQQAWGRGVRAPDDYADCFVLDAAVLRLIREYPDLWSPWVSRQTAIWTSD